MFRKNNLLVVRCGDTKVKVRRDIIKRLRVLDDACECEDKSRYIDLGTNNKDKAKWLLIATKWATIEPNDYVLPADTIEAKAVMEALRFYGVDEKDVKALRTPSELRSELLRLKDFAKSAVQRHMKDADYLRDVYKDKPEHKDKYDKLVEDVAIYLKHMEFLNE
jgi:hypothetical protein